MPESLKRLIQSISYLPWIWENRATKLAFFLLNSNENFTKTLGESIQEIKNKVTQCQNCHGLTDMGQDICNTCKSTQKNHAKIAVVEEYLDMVTLESSGGFDWVYHILGWAISPINGIFVWDLSFEKLFQRVIESDEKVELILATNPNIEWEATANYIIEEIENRNLKYKTRITKLSRGLSSGYLEYADNVTLMNALKERKEV